MVYVYTSAEQSHSKRCSDGTALVSPSKGEQAGLMGVEGEDKGGGSKDRVGDTVVKGPESNCFGEQAALKVVEPQPPSVTVCTSVSVTSHTTLSPASIRLSTLDPIPHPTYSTVIITSA